MENQLRKNNKQHFYSKAQLSISIKPSRRTFNRKLIIKFFLIFPQQHHEVAVKNWQHCGSVEQNGEEEDKK